MTDLARLNEELQRVVLAKHATPHERALLAAAGDPETIVVRVAFQDDLICGPPGAAPVEEGEIADPSHEDVRAILRRVELRKELGLPARPCGARRPRESCDCLETTLDVLGKGEPSKRDVVDAAKELHAASLAEAKRLERERKARLAANKRAAVRAKLARAPVAILDSIPKPSPAKAEKEPKRLWRQRLEPAHPLSEAAFRAEEGRIDWRTKQF
jgi:hypothetical protein